MSAFFKGLRAGNPAILMTLLSVLVLAGAGNILGIRKAISDQTLLSDAYQMIQKVQKGRILIQKVLTHLGLANEDALFAQIRFGDVSKTDALLTRSFDVGSGREIRSRKITIYVRRNQAFGDQVLDLAHELAHASDGPEWDPYDPELTAGKYIRASIEGRGGEVFAILTECGVAVELRAMGVGLSLERCRDYEAALGFDRDRIRQDFYKVGRWRDEIISRLGHEQSYFPNLSDDPAPLFSSTGRAPYPVSLYNEYIQMTRAACENSQRRLERIKTEKGGRKPSSMEKGSHEFLVKRCFSAISEI